MSQLSSERASRDGLRSGRIIMMAVAALAVFTAVTLLPYQFPVHDGISLSYAVGFSNRAAQAIFLVASLLFGLAFRGPAFIPSIACKLSSTAVARAVYFATAALTLAATAFFWFWERRIVPVNESQYFLDRLACYQRGLVIYRDFHFDYGPLMLYPVGWLAKLSHLQPGDAYFLIWLVEWQIGIALLWFCVRSLVQPSSAALTYLALWSGFFSSVGDSGLNYTPLRFTAAVALALVWHRHFETSQWDKRIILAAAGLAGAALLFFSPEQGLAFALAIAGYFIVCAKPLPRHSVSGIAVFLFVFAVALWIAAHIGVMDTMGRMASGAMSYPVLPQFTVLMWLALALMGATALLSAITGGHRNHPAIIAGAVSTALLPAAFGRSDSGHIFINLIGVVIVAMAMLARFRLFHVAVCIVVLIQTGRLIVLRLPVAFVEITQQRVQPSDAEKTRLAAGWTHLAPSAHVLAPLAINRHVVPDPGDRQIDTGTYPGFREILSRDEVNEKISELRSQPAALLYLPLPSQRACYLTLDDVAKGISNITTPAFLHLRIRNTPYLGNELCEYIAERYRPAQIIPLDAQYRFFEPVSSPQ